MQSCFLSSCLTTTPHSKRHACVQRRRLTYLTIRPHSTCHGMLPLCQSPHKNLTPQAEEDIADELIRRKVPRKKPAKSRAVGGDCDSSQSPSRCRVRQWPQR